MEVVKYLIIAILGIFTILSIAFQVRAKLPFKGIWRFDNSGLMPNYTFFAPRPLTQDFRVIYRSSGEGGKKDWQELDIYKKAPFLSFCFNGFKYYNKGLIDSCIALLTEFRELNDDSKNFIQVSSNYIGIFNVIKSNLEGGSTVHKEVEFAVVSTQNTIDNRMASILFRSFKHDVSMN